MGQTCTTTNQRWECVRCGLLVPSECSYVTVWRVSGLLNHISYIRPLYESPLNKYSAQFFYFIIHRAVRISEITSLEKWKNECNNSRILGIFVECLCRIFVCCRSLVCLKWLACVLNCYCRRAMNGRRARNNIVCRPIYLHSAFTTF